LERFTNPTLVLLVLSAMKLSVSKGATQKFHMERFNLRKLEDEEKYEVKISNGFTALEIV
jgi:hypothetical protein